MRVVTLTVTVPMAPVAVPMAVHVVVPSVVVVGIVVGLSRRLDQGLGVGRVGVDVDVGIAARFGQPLAICAIHSRCRHPLSVHTACMEVEVEVEV